MTNKTFTLFSLGILTLLVLTSFVSALTITAPDDFTGNSTTLIIKTNSTESGNLFLSYISDLDIEFNETFSLAVENDSTYNIKATIQNDTDDLNYGDYIVQFNSTLGGVSNTTDATYTRKFYEGENKGNLKISDIDLDVLSGFGDKDKYWYPLDEVELTFNVENRGELDIENIEVELCIWDKTKGKCIFDEDDMDISENDFKLDSDKDKDITVTLILNGDKLTSGNTDYSFYIKTVGEIDDKDSPYHEDKTGDSNLENIEIVTNDDFVIINNFQFDSENISCGDLIELTADVWNIGDSDLDKDKIFVKVYNKDLELNEFFTFSSGIDSMDFEKIVLPLRLKDVESGNYNLLFTVYDDERMASKDIFDTKEEDDKAIYSTLLQVDGSCSTTPKSSVTNPVYSKTGNNNLIVNITVTNIDSVIKTFTFSVDSYSDWASSATLDKTSLTLNAGESKIVSVSFEIKEDISGENGFNFEVTEGTKYMFQPVSVTIEKASFFPSLTGLVSGFGNNAYLYGIIALNAILVLVIIFVSIRIAKKKKE